MKKVSEIFICDVCNKEEVKMQTISYPVLFTTDQTEGKPRKPYISQEKLDLCSSCLDKIVKLQGSGAQGHNTYKLKK
jgi:hypothetical protein